MLHTLKAIERVFDLDTSDFVKEKYVILDELLQKLKDNNPVERDREMPRLFSKP